MSQMDNYAAKQAFSMAGPIASYGTSIVIIGILSSIALAKIVELPTDEAHKQQQHTITGTVSAVVGISGLGIIAMIITGALARKRRHKHRQRYGGPQQSQQPTRLRQMFGPRQF